jgi:hypothetical protein
MKYYFYSDKTKVRKGQEYYTVYEVEAVKGDVDIADRRAKTKASQRKDKLAGGYFNKKSLPYNFKTNYKIIKVPLKTKVSPYTKADLAIIGLIEAEANMEYEIL